MSYRYIGCTEDNKVIKGTIAAPSAEAAAGLLSNRGYRIYSLKPVSDFLPNPDELVPSLFKAPIKPQTIIVFSRQLSLLLESGTDIVTALQLLEAQNSNKRFKKVIGEITADLRSGSRLSSALRKHPDIFSTVYVQSVSVGEHSGGLERVLRQVADHIEKDTKTLKQIKGALKYPMIVSVVALIVIGVLVTFVLPAFSELYGQLGAELPTLTRITLDVFDWFSAYGTYLIGGLLMVMVLAYLYTRTADGKLLRDKLLLKLPLLGQASHLSELVRCCRTMSILYLAGLPVPEIMSLASESSNNLVIKDALLQVQRDVLVGEGLSSSMAKNPFFLPMMVQMVGVGEATGSLDVSLQATADTYETEAQDRMQALIGAIQPAITLAIAIVVSIIALSLITAMYSVYGQAM